MRRTRETSGITTQCTGALPDAFSHGQLTGQGPVIVDVIRQTEVTWPKKHTRQLHIGDIEYLWHLSRNSIYRETPITVGTRSGKYFLHIDPYDHDFSITPSSIRGALEWALHSGWSPHDGPTRNMTFSDGSFQWLPDDVRFKNQLQDSPPSDLRDTTDR